MYDIKALEDEWKQYKKKKRRPLYLGALALLIVVGAGVFFLGSQKYHFTLPKVGSFFSKEDLVEKDNDFLFDAPLKEVIEVQKVQKPVEVKQEMPREEEVVETLPLGAIPQEKKKIALNIVETSSVKAYTDVARRFKKLHDPDDSLFLAKSYYKKRAYKKAEYWALQTNSVNSNIEESWLIFAKAKAKRGRKKEAMRILKAYIKRSNSLEAKKLLRKIKKGNF
jgi:hypothetical protein